MPRWSTLALLLAVAFGVSACVVAPVRGGGGWCYHHPYRCR
jgi:hypothetical protein